MIDAALAGLSADLADLAGPAPEPEQHLKQVTVLFLDVVGSTALGQKLDPEEFSGVMDGVLSPATRIGRLWTYLVDELPWCGERAPAAFYRFSPDRKGERPRDHLAGFSGGSRRTPTRAMRP